MPDSIRRSTTDWQRITTLWQVVLKRVWYNKHLKKSTKLQVYRTVALTTLLYGSESWVIYTVTTCVSFRPFAGP